MPIPPPPTATLPDTRFRLEPPIARAGHDVADQDVAGRALEPDAEVAAADEPVALEAIAVGVAYHQRAARVEGERVVGDDRAGRAAQEQEPSAVVLERVPADLVAVARVEEHDARDLVVVQPEVLDEPALGLGEQLPAVAKPRDGAFLDPPPAVALVTDSVTEADPVDRVAVEVDDDPVRRDQEPVAEAVLEVVGHADAA